MQPLWRNAFRLHKKEYPVPALVREVQALSDGAWHAKAKSGGWSSITLKGPKGHEGTFLNEHDIEQGIDGYAYTAQGKACPAIREVIEKLGTDVYLVRLLKLSPGELVKYHTDEVVFKDVRRVVRLHMAIVTNTRATLRFGTPLQAPAEGYNVWKAETAWEIHLPVGEMWFTNVNALHSVYNGGKEDRIHLVADVKPKEELLKILEGN